MSKTVSVNYDHLPKGAEVEVLHLGVFKNGHDDQEVSEDQIVHWEKHTDRKFPSRGLKLPEKTRRSTPVAEEENTPATGATEEESK